MSSITAFMSNGKYAGKGPFVYKQNLLSKFTRLFINAVVYMVLFLSNKIYCLQMFNFDGQEDDQA